jgi:hypothetical protein
MNISDRILKTIKKIAIDRNITEESVTYNEIAVEQAIELNKLNKMKKNKLKERIELLENKICTLSENNHKLQNNT